MTSSLQNSKQKIFTSISKNFFANTDPKFLRFNDEIIGLQDIKEKIKEITNSLMMSNIQKSYDLESFNSSFHMSFTGTSGTGKTVIANQIAHILRNLGFLKKGHIISVTREDLVGQYVGHTAPKTREQLEKARGGILFLDQAYDLHKIDNERDYGNEAVELLLQVMENNRHDFLFIFSGEEIKMKSFFKSNPGIASRIGYHFNFRPYTAFSLLQIAKELLVTHYHCFARKKAENYLYKLFISFSDHPLFGNVYGLKIFFDSAFMFQASKIERKLTIKKRLSLKTLIQLDEEDFFLAKKKVSILFEKVSLFE